MSQIHNDLCLKGIEELRQIFKEVQTQTKQQTKIQQNENEIEVERVIETTQPSQYQTNNHCHPICIPQVQSYPITYQPYIIVQEQQMEEKKSKKKKRKFVSAIQEQIQVQEIVSKNRKRIESPKINIEKELDHLEQLIRQVKVQIQPSQIQEYSISIPEVEKSKDNSEIITMISALKSQPIQLPKDDYVKIENARLHEEAKQTQISLHELQVKYDELLKRKRKEKIVKEIEYKEIPQIVEVPRDVIKEVIKPIEVVKEVIKEIKKPDEIKFKEIPIYIPEYKEVTVNKEVPVYKEIPVEKSINVYKDIPVYKDVPVYHDVPIFRDVSIYQKVPIYKEVPQYSEPVDVYKEIVVQKNVQRIPERILEIPNLGKTTSRIIQSKQHERSYIRSPYERRQF
ncbi:unnamed protein product [Paramecium sonneborni]|uniref:Uncharacterized protein n=1 Tax=Paramecium sonneborni TaxID=65129 RepID=A0A8S1QV67_9CILI|nr:unnamed protein product [Paramecium sonneborni]